MPFLDKENSGKIKKPLNPHTAAIRNPNTEVSVCLTKIGEIQVALDNFFDTRVDKYKVFDTCRSRAIHISHRVFRLGNLPRFQSISQHLQRICENLIQLIEECLCNICTIEQGQTNLKEIMSQLPENTANFDFRDKKPVEIQTNSATTASNNPDENRPIEPPATSLTIAPEDPDNPQVDQAHQNQTQYISLSYNPSEFNTSSVTNYNSIRPPIKQNNSTNNATASKGNTLATQDRNLSSSLHPFNPGNSGLVHDLTSSTPNSIHPMSIKNSNHAMSRPPSEIMRHWNFFFDGISQDLSIDEFIMRVEHLSKTNYLPYQMLAENLYVLLKGVALNYYWKCIKNICPFTWNNLKQELVEKFQNLRTDSQLRRSINARKQKHGESFVSFYNTLQEMISSLQTNISNQEMLNLIRNNMRPGLQMSLAIQKYTHIGELVSDCITMEENWSRFNYNPDSFNPPRRFVNEISAHVDSNLPNQALPTEELCAFDNPNASSNHIHSKLSNTIHPKPSKQNQICWNCKNYGHIFKDCELPPKSEIFCYGCGKPGVLKPNCVSCSGNKVRSMTSGVTHTSAISYPSRETSDVACNVDPDFRHYVKRK